VINIHGRQEHGDARRTAENTQPDEQEQKGSEQTGLENEVDEITALKNELEKSQEEAENTIIST